MEISKCQLTEEVNTKVCSEIKESTRNKIENYFQENLPRLRGMNKTDEFYKNMLNYTIYKDLEGVGYNALQSKIPETFKISNDSLQHNTKEVRNVLKEWAKTQITLGNATLWRNASKNLKRPKWLKKAILKKESSDFKTICKGKMSKMSTNYSHRENSYACQYIVWKDLEGKVVKLDGPYSPQLIGSDYMKSKRNFISKNLKEDGYFGELSGVENVESFPLEAKSEKEIKRITQICEKEGISKDEYLKTVKEICSDSPLNWAKEKFKSLGKKFSEPEEEQEKILHFAIAVRNNEFEK
jgi:hypothetical protein